MTEKNIIIQSSFLLINCRQYIISAKRKTELNDEFIVFPIDIDNETKLIYLSFKHVLRIEIMNNGNTAGLALHVDEFMAEKFQYLLKDGGTVLPQSPDSPKRSIVFDILNADPQKLTTIREILQSAGLFRHNYVVKQIRKNRRFRIANPTTLPFICKISATISELQWNAMLDKLGFGKTAMVKEEPSDVDVCVPRQFFPPPPPPIGSRSKSVGAAVSQDEPPVLFFNNPVEYSKSNRVNRPPGIGKPPPVLPAHTSSKLPVSQFPRVGYPKLSSADFALGNGIPRKKFFPSVEQWPREDKQREKSQMPTGGGGGGDENNAPAMSNAERLKKLAGIPGEKELWIETRDELEGKVYFYHAETREGTWQRPEAANTIVMSKDKLLELAKREEAEKMAKLQLHQMCLDGIPGYGYVFPLTPAAGAASTSAGSSATFSSVVNSLELDLEEARQWPNEARPWKQFSAPYNVEEQAKLLKRKRPEKNCQMLTDEIEMGKEQKKKAAISCSHQMEPSPGPGDGLWSHLTKRLLNPEANLWNKSGGTKVKISSDGLYALNSTRLEGMDVFAEQPFPITSEHARKDFFPGTILYYFEVKHLASSFNLWGFYVGLSDGIIPEGSLLGCSTHFYGIPDNCDFCFLEGEKHYFQWPQGAIKPKWKDQGNVVGCGIMISPKDNVSIFFTLNGQLMGKQMPIRPSIGRLFPTLTMWNSSFEANFGNDPTKKFAYDINKCQGLVFDLN